MSWGFVGILFVVVVVLALSPVVVVAVWSSIMQSGQRNRWRPPEFGVEFVEGRPGSGKSFVCVFNAVRFILRDRRPVYTNLPIVMPVLRAYLRNRGREEGGHALGEVLAGLIHELHEQHFRNFLERQHLLKEFREKREALARLQGRPISFDSIKAAFAREHGPFVDRNTIDPRTGALVYGNWIEQNAVVIIDEAHHWFPMADQQGETRHLLDYVTMCRHHLHYVWIVSQDRMQVNKRFRDMCQAFWIVRNRADERLVLGLKYKHLGVRCFTYSKWTPEGESARSADDHVPVESFNIYWWLPKYSWVFRVYRSFTHLGGVYAMRESLRRSRLAAGLDEDGNLRVQRSAAASAPIAESEGDDVGFIGRVVRASMFAGVCFLGGVVTSPVVVEYLSRSSPVAAVPAALEVKPDASDEPGSMSGVPDPGGGPLIASMTEAAFPFGALQSVSDSGVRVDGVAIPVGGAYGGVKLIQSSGARSRAVFVFDDRVWVWRFGAQVACIGSVGSVADRIRAVEGK